LRRDSLAFLAALTVPSLRVLFDLTTFGPAELLLAVVVALPLGLAAALDLARWTARASA
jgi:hypothetical protein